MKVIESYWFTTNDGCMGIVVIENDVGERKAYAGTVSGEDEKADTDKLITWGNKLSPAVAQRLANQLQAQVSVLKLDNGKQVYIDGKSISQEEAQEIIISLTKTWGTDFEKQELKDKALML